jgi:hypothetical protein
MRSNTSGRGTPSGTSQNATRSCLGNASIAWSGPNAWDWGSRSQSRVRRLLQLSNGKQWRSLLHQLKFTFPSPHAGIRIAAELNPIHRLAGRIQAKDMFIGLTDVLDRTELVWANSSNTVL